MDLPKPVHGATAEEAAGALTGVDAEIADHHGAAAPGHRREQPGGTDAGTGGAVRQQGQHLARIPEAQVGRQRPVLRFIEGNPGFVVVPGMVALDHHTPLRGCLRPPDQLSQHLRLGPDLGGDALLCEHQQAVGRGAESTAEAAQVRALRHEPEATADQRWCLQGRRPVETHGGRFLPLPLAMQQHQVAAVAAGEFADQLVAHHGRQRPAEHRGRSPASVAAELSVAMHEPIELVGVLQKQADGGRLLQQGGAQQRIGRDLQLGPHRRPGAVQF